MVWWSPDMTGAFSPVLRFPPPRMTTFTLSFSVHRGNIPFIAGNIANILLREKWHYFLIDITSFCSIEEILNIFRSIENTFTRFRSTLHRGHYQQFSFGRGTFINYLSSKGKFHPFVFNWGLDRSFH